jgi:hypothetical protein
MAEVFISYKREDRPWAERVDAALKAAGLNTWWDTSLVAGEHFNAAIDRELQAASCVVVIWSEAAKVSRWVNAEAVAGFDRDILVGSRIDGVKLGYPFSVVQTVDLRAAGGLERLVDGVREKLGFPAPMPVVAPSAAATEAPPPSAAKVEAPASVEARFAAANTQLRDAVGAALATGGLSGYFAEQGQYGGLMQMIVLGGLLVTVLLAMRATATGAVAARQVPSRAKDFGFLAAAWLLSAVPSGGWVVGIGALLTTSLSDDFWWNHLIVFGLTFGGATVIAAFIGRWFGAWRLRQHPQT